MINLLKTFALTGGEWVIYVLIACSVLAVAVMIERGWLLFKEIKQLKIVQGLFKEGKFQELAGTSGLPAKVLSAGYSNMSQGPASVEDYAQSAATQERHRLETRMIILGTLGNNAIYIGLFGTVLGVIKSFHDLAMSTNAGPEVVMQGLSEALIATATGLMVALPCVITYNVYQKLIKDLLVSTDAMVRNLIAQSKSQGK